MKKLDYIDTVYKINNKRKFDAHDVNARDFDLEIIKKVVDFAYEMCFGEGFHRPSRSGGTDVRESDNLFRNTFQGKLAEELLYNNLKSSGIECSAPDYSIYGEGTWDNGDLIAGNKKISVKSSAWYSNLLLLETKDYDKEGNYLHNNEPIDFFVLVRISPNLSYPFNDKTKAGIEKIVYRESWQYDIAGWISKTELAQAICDGQIIRKNSYLNAHIDDKKHRIDADNYYIQAGDLHPLGELIPLLR